MITKVIAKNFKNLTFEQDFEQQNLIVGPNGSGKSARTQALMLAILGYIPGTDEKRNDRILDNFTTGDKLTVSCLIGKTEFGRQWKRTAKGTVTQKFLINGTKASKDDFIAGMASNGRPTIMDLVAFMALSDAKKIGMLFKMFPPGTDIESLDNQIDKLSTKKNTIFEEIRHAEKSIARLSKDRASLELPSGTLAEVTAEIENNDKEIERVQAEINNIKTKQAEEAAAEKARIEAEQKAKANEQARIAEMEANIKARERIEAEEEQKAGDQTQTGIIEDAFFHEIDPKDGKQAAPDARESTFKTFRPPEYGPKQSIQKIIDTILKVNCKVCVNGAAIMVAKKEIQKY